MEAADHRTYGPARAAALLKTKDTDRRLVHGSAQPHDGSIREIRIAACPGDYGLRQIHPALNSIRQQADLTHLDATLGLFDPTIRLSELRPRRRYVRNSWFRQGECLQLIYDALREAGQPITTRDLSERIMQIKAIPAVESHTRDLVQRTPLASLNRAKATIARSDVGCVVGWRLI